MRSIAKLTVAILFVVVLMLGALAMIDNQAQVALHFLDWQTFQLSIYWWLLMALASGFLLGWVFASLGSLRRRVGMRQTRRQLAVSQQEVERLRESP